MTAITPVRDPMDGFDHRSALPHSATGGPAGEGQMSLHDVEAAQFPLVDNTPDTLHNGPVQVVEMLLRSDALFKVLAGLPANQRRAWLMRGGSGLSYLVIAGKVGVPLSTVRGLLARSRHTLALELASWR